MPDLTYADDIVILSSSYSEMQGLLEAVNCHAAAVGMRMNASKTKVMSTLIPGEQHQAVLLDGEPLKDVERFKFLGSLFFAYRHCSCKEGSAGFVMPQNVSQVS